MMASQSKTPAPAAPLQNLFMFKGHPQPSVDERLKQARNFLADEDVNRCLDFTSKLAEIEQFLQHVEKENLPRNQYLFGDVKAMADVQKDWTKRMDQPPADNEGPDAPSIPSYSTRLINLETAAKFQQQREAYGMVTQMRDDHPPFTIERSKDQVDFLSKMIEDARTDPGEVDPTTNLLFVENRAYNSALREPSRIPTWMHWRRGLPNKGVKPTGSKACYRENARMRKVPSAPALRPHKFLVREVLPRYLQRREDEINRLLKSHQVGTVSSNLADLLLFHAPAALQELRREYDYLLSIEDLLSSEERLRLTTVMTTLDKKHNEWVEVLRPAGVQIRLSHTSWTDTNTPGIFYVADRKPTRLDRDRIYSRERKINSLLASSDISTTEQIQLMDELNDFIPAEMRRCDDRAQAILIKAGKKTHATFSKLSQTQREEFNRLQLEALTKNLRHTYLNAKAQKSSLFDSWLGTLRGTNVTLKYLLPGEIYNESQASLSPDQLYVSWSPEVERLLQLPPAHIRQLESDINDSLYVMETTGETEPLNTRLDSLLKSVVPPDRVATHLPNRSSKQETTPKNSSLNPNSSDENEEHARVIGLSSNQYRHWKDILIRRKVEIRMPDDNEGENQDVIYSPGYLYYRGINDGLRYSAHQDNDLSRWAGQINEGRRGRDSTEISPLDNLNTWEKEMYDLLAHLQYPFLKRMDVAWRALQAIPSVDANMVDEFRTSWARGFKAWLAMILTVPYPIAVKRAAQDNETHGDPGVVYYHGPTPKPDFQSEEENQDALPEDIQKLVNQIDGLMREYTKEQTKDVRDQLEALLRDFWRPVRDREDHQDVSKDPSLTFDEIEQLRGWEEDYNRRLLLFAQESAIVGFKLKMHRSGSYVAEDPTAKLIEHWRTRGDHRMLDHSPQYFRKLLHHLWLYPKRFYRTLRDTEVEINDFLQALSPNNLPIDEDGARLLRVMRPFLPHVIAELARQLEGVLSGGSLMAHSVEPQHVPIQESFVALYSQWVRQLQRYARTKWIKILVWDEQELSTGSFAGFEGRLYFPRPAASAALIHEDNHLSDPLPIRFQRYQCEINYLLKKRKLQLQFPDKPFTFKENDRLRQLLHLAMNPITAKADSELRDIDEKSRIDILQGEELTSYLSKLEIWQTKYDEWVDSFPDGGIELQALGEDTPRNNAKPAVKYVHIGNDQPLPPPSRSRTLPLHVKRMTREFKTALRAKRLTNLEQKAVSSRYGPLVKSSYREDFNALREYFFREQFPDKVHPNSQIPPNSEVTAIVKCVEDLAFKAIWERLRRVATTERLTGTALEIYEPLRGELRIKLKKLNSPAVLEDESDASKAKPSLMIPGIEEAGLEYLPLATKVRNDVTLTELERAEISKQFKPLSDKDRMAETGQVLVLILKAYDGQQLTDLEEAQAKELMLKSLWKHFESLCPDLVERACPGLRYSTTRESFLDLTTPEPSGQPPTPSPPYPAPTEAEIREAGTEINNLLQKFRDGTIIDKEDQILDNLLRPLVNDRLRELDKQMNGLTLVMVPTDHSPTPSYQSRQLNSRQSLYLLELQTQWAVEFEKWKTSLPRYGVIIDEWYSEPDVIPNVISRYRAVRDALSRPQDDDPKDQESLEIFLALKRYITDSTFTDDDGKLMLQRLPPALACLRDVLFGRKEALDARNRRISLSEGVSLNLLEHEFVTRYMAWYNAVPLREKILSQEAAITDFSGKAERRGVQRAAIELALNLLATNQEQRRPLDSFRRVLLPPAHRPPLKEVQLCLPLEPWKRPVEQDPFKITNLLLKYRKWKDYVFSVARTRAIDTLPGRLEPPINYNGPCTLASEHQLWASVKSRESQLVQLQAALINAGKNAPRPLIHRLTTIINEALVLSSNDMSYLPAKNGQEKLDKKDISILSSLSAPSWNEDWKPYGESIPAIDNSADHNRARLNEFERDVNLFLNELPLWQPASVSPPLLTDPNDPDFYVQAPYNASTNSISGWGIDTLVQNKINKNRTGRAKGLHAVHLWSTSEATVYLKEMHNARRIHFQSTSEQQLIAKIPPSGHPENKYIVSLTQLATSPYIYRNSENKWEVHYDESGTTGKPILQPNLYEYLQKVAYKVGRDIRELHSRISGSRTKTEIRKEQREALKLTHGFMDDVITGAEFQSSIKDQSWIAKDISLGKFARDLHKVAPDLAEEARINMDSDTVGGRGHAIILQMQLIQESNNNWDSLFPENEHVWGFAASRLSPQPQSTKGRPVQRRTNQYFNLRRWPVWVQNEKEKAAMETSGLAIQGKPAPPASDPQVQEEVAGDMKEDVTGDMKEEVATDMIKEMPRERYTGRGGPAMFPFGETPYQQAYLSWKMEQDLADVEEFNPKPPRRRFLSGKRKVVEEPSVDRYALPSIPDGWAPDSVSWNEKLYDVSERARLDVEGFPQNLDHYYTQEQIENIKFQEESKKYMKLQDEARAMVEAREGRPYNELTRAEISTAYEALDIDPYTEIVRPKPPPRAPSRGTQDDTKKPAPSTSTGGIPVISQLFGKRKAEAVPAERATTNFKRARVESESE